MQRAGTRRFSGLHATRRVEPKIPSPSFPAPCSINLLQFWSSVQGVPAAFVLDLWDVDVDGGGGEQRDVGLRDDGLAAGQHDVDARRRNGNDAGTRTPELGEGLFTGPPLQRFAALLAAAPPREREQHEHTDPDQASAEEDRQEAISLRDVLTPLVLERP